MSGFYLPADDEFDPSLDDFVPSYILPVESKIRNYKHFDLPLPKSALIKTFDFSSEHTPHRFLPLLGFTDRNRKFSPDIKGKKLQTVKERPIRFAGHKDAFYLQAYASHLNEYYERALLKDGISKSVIAYRKGGGTNIHHAKSLFDEIKKRGDCTVIAMDISGFFDNIDHEILRDEIAKLLNRPNLIGHHATVWKNMTRYSWVETEDLDHILGRNRHAHGRICSEADFRNHVRGRRGGLIQSNTQPFGIPQGTPVSGLYANIYLRTFDHTIIELCKHCGGSYRRYSDDIAVVLPLGAKVPHVVSIVGKLLADVRLTLSVHKTESARFRNGKLITSYPIQYLGFTFDGHNILIRPSSIAAYLRKMRRGIHAKMVAAKMQNIPRTQIFKRESLSRYTHLGKRRNFISYAHKAAHIMNSPEIKKQIRKHKTWFNRVWNKELEIVFNKK